MTKQFSYSRAEKLKSRKQLEELFAAGKGITVFPVKMFYTSAAKQDNIIKTGVGVSKKYFKKATERNRIKRLMREAYRTEKVPLHLYLNSRNKQVALFLLYIDKTLPEFDFLKEKIRLCIKKLIAELDAMVTENT